MTQMQDQFHFESTSYDAAVKELSEAVQWLSAIGVSIASTRPVTVTRQMERIAEAYRAGKLERLLLDEGTQGVLDALFETAELRLIHRGLSQISSSELKKRLGNFVKGPVAYRDERPESSSNRARDIGFELSLGAQLLIAGFEVEFHPDGDLRFRFEGHEFFIECKRPQASHQINSRVRDALKQLRKRYDTSAAPKDARGLVALSLTKLANPYGSAFQHHGKQDLRGFHIDIANSIIEEHGRRWQRPEDKRTLGALLEMRTLSIGTSDDSVNTGSNITLNTREGLDKDSERVLKRFGDTILSNLRP